MEEGPMEEEKPLAGEGTEQQEEISTFAAAEDDNSSLDAEFAQGAEARLQQLLEELKRKVADQSENIEGSTT